MTHPKEPRYSFLYNGVPRVCTVTAVWLDRDPIEGDRLRVTVESRAADSCDVATFSAERTLCRWVAWPSWHVTGPDGKPELAQLGRSAADAFETAATAAKLPTRCTHKH